MIKQQVSRHRSALFACLSASAAFIVWPTGATATELPINLCATSGATGAPLPPSGGQPGTISFTPPSGEGTLAKSASAGAPLGAVDPSTGAFVYDHDDLSIGVGDFPASLRLTRLFNSRSIVGSGRPVYRAGGERWYAFGLGSTHNLDIRFERSLIFFDKEQYVLNTISIGFTSYSFQVCSNGVAKSLRGDGTRLFVDNTYPNGFRFEGRDGTKIWFETVPQNKNGGPFYCANGPYSVGVSGACGFARRWVAPNGDRADFSYEMYNSNATNQARPGGNRDYAMTGEGAAEECYINTKGARDCRQVNRPWYVMRTGQTSPILSFPVYDFRLKEVVNSRGFKLAFDYVDSSTSAGGYCPSAIGNNLQCNVSNGNNNMLRNRIAAVTAYHSDSGNYSQHSIVRYGYKKASGFDGDLLREFTDVAGGVTKYSNLFDIQLPGSDKPSLKITWDQSKGGEYYLHADEVLSGVDYSGQYADFGRRFTYYPTVSSIQRGPDAAVNYTRTKAGRWLPDAYGRWRWDEFHSVITETVNGNEGTQSSQMGFLDQSFDDHFGPSWIKDQLGRLTRFIYNERGSLISQVSPDGSTISYVYDARGNTTSITRIAKPGSDLPERVETSGFSEGPLVEAEGCENIFTCNRPIWSKDALGRQIDFEWSAEDGLLTRMLEPALEDGSRAELSMTYMTVAGMSGWPVKLVQAERRKLGPSSFAESRFEYSTKLHKAVKSVTNAANGLTFVECFRTNAVGLALERTKAMGYGGRCVE